MGKGKREKIYKRDGGKCLACGSDKNLTLDHIVPKIKGGKGIGMENLQTLCKKCNGTKGDIIIDFRKN